MRVVQIGVGGFGKFWRKALGAVPGLEVVGIVDTNAANLADAQAQFALVDDACFADPYGDWHKRVKADFIIDSTPHAFHYENALRALRGGMNVIVVKPMSDAITDARTMVRESERLGRKLAVAQQLRFFPACLKLKELIADRSIGEVAYAQVDAFFKRVGPVREKWYQPYPLLMEAAIHHFDLIRWILNLEADTVMAESWNMPWNDEVWGKKSACCIFRMTNDAHIVFRGIASDQPDGAYPGSWVIEGTNGLLRLHENRISVNGEQVWPEGTETPPGLDLASLNEVVLRQAVEYFANEGTTSIHGADNLHSVAMVFASIKSSESGRRVRLQDLE